MAENHERTPIKGAEPELDIETPDGDMERAKGDMETAERDIETAERDVETAGQEMETPKDGPKPGVVYLSSIPKFMPIETLREKLAIFGRIGRVFLKPESDENYERRLSRGGRKARLYDEGWVEFVEKKNAKKCALALNAQPIGGKKAGNQWHDQLWNIRYLNRFTWEDLRAHATALRMSRKTRLRNELREFERETEHYVEHVVKASNQKTAKKAIERRRQKRAEQQESAP